jgi:hypothetical protein
MNPDIFFISSVIKTSNNPWYHTHIRSPFTPEERFNQTLYTIETIRNLNDGTKILLVDCSDLDKYMEDTLKSKVDYYIQLYDNDEIRNICMNSKQKGHGEILQTKAVIDYIKTHNIKFNRLFKISGRYFLNEKFSKENYSTTHFTFKYANEINTPHTILYCVPYNLLNNYERGVDNGIYIYSRFDCGSFEIMMGNVLGPSVGIKTLGIEGYVCHHLEDGSIQYLNL